MLYDLFSRPFAMEWQKEGDEWVNHLFFALESHGITGRTSKTSQGSEEVPFPHIECRPHPQKFRSWLVIRLVDAGIYILVAYEKVLPHDEVAAWTSAVEAANENLSRARRQFDWGAIIGPLKDIEERQALDTPASVGPLLLRPGGVFFTERGEPHFPSLSSWRGCWSWPIIVEGRSSGYNWDVASRLALLDLHRLCELLSVAWGRCWVLRHVPEVRDSGATVPEPREISDITESSVERKTVQVPSWANLAWRLTESRPEVARALRVHYEGLQMHYRHPSFALLAYVGSIEALGEKLYKPQHCEKCGTMIGSIERFRKALGLVAPENDVKRLTKVVYPRRSETAHKGQLHGIESMFGATFPGFFETLIPDSPMNFGFGILREIRQANRNLLEGVFSGRLSI